MATGQVAIPLLLAAAFLLGVGETLFDSAAQASLPAAAAALRRASGAQPRSQPDRRRVSVPVGDGARSLTAAVRELEAAAIAVEDVGPRRPTLDEVFLRLTDHRATERDANEEAAA